MDLTERPSAVERTIRSFKEKGSLTVLTPEELDEALRGVQIPKYADAVFEGGGVKGIALAGAIMVAEHLGVTWKKVGGTSAGAITACLLAAGYNADEIIRIVVTEMDFRLFMDKGLLDRIPGIGKLASVLFERGIYEGVYFQKWLAERLAAKGVRTFSDLPGDPDDRNLKLVASDITRRKMLVLPEDLRDYERNPEDFPVARAARMSMSLPYFFEPVEMTYTTPRNRVEKATIVDGGILSNFPVWLFDARNGTPKWPTYGFKLVGPGHGLPAPTRRPLQFARALVGTMLEAHDKAHVSQANFDRTIAIPTMGIQTTQFDLTDQDKTLLLRSGQEAAIRFFRTWSFEEHNRKYRSTTD